MKASEFKKLIREEVRRVVKEEDDNYGEGFGYMKPFTKDITAAISNLKAINNKIEIQGPLSVYLDLREHRMKIVQCYTVLILEIRIHLNLPNFSS